MPKNYSQDRLDNRLLNDIIEMKKQLKDLRTNQSTWLGYFPIPVRTSDPAVTGAGVYGLYYNSSTGKVRKSYNSSAWSDTTI